jgi:nitric oxide reductase subunit C
MEVKQNKIISIPTYVYRLILAVLMVVFTIYNYWVYTSSGQNTIPVMSDQAIDGEILWQKSNCTSCHQLYGLGGYMGPDLTNIISRPNKGPIYTKAFLNSGVKAMPKFNFSEIEKDNIIAFLTHIDRTGYFPNKHSQLEKTGWVNLKYKTSKNIENE